MGRLGGVGALGKVVVLWAAVGVLLAGPARAIDRGGIPAEHQRPLLTAAEEQAWLAQQLQASPHYQMWLQRPPEAPLPPAQPVKQAGASPAIAVPLAPPSAFPAPKAKRVYGYLPYWTKKTAIIPWGTVTQVSWFSAGIGESGAITSLANWNTADSKAFIQLAHSKGAQVTLTFTQFSTAAISKILATPDSRKTAVDNIVATVIAGGGDGCNIDFEGMAKADRDKMNAFTQLLTETFAQKLPGADVTLATPAVDWSDAWDYQFLAEHSDGLMIMAYAMHWGGSNPGPQLPMKADKPWTHKTLQWIVNDYLTWGKASNKGKFIVGLPLYGMTWPSASAQPGAAKLANAKSVFFSAAQDLAAKSGGWLWDAASESPYLAVNQAGTWMQTWCDNLKSFENRLNYLGQQDLPMGLWALGYSDGDPAVAAAIETWQNSGAVVPADPGPEPGPEPKPDAGAAELAEPQPDAGATPDSGAPADGAQPADLGAVSDLSPAVDSQPAADAAVAKDADTIWFYDDADPAGDAAAKDAPASLDAAPLDGAKPAASDGAAGGADAAAQDLAAGAEVDPLADQSVATDPGPGGGSAVNAAAVKPAGGCQAAAAVPQGWWTLLVAASLVWRRRRSR